MKMPYATAYTLLKQSDVAEPEAHKAADIIDRIDTVIPDGLDNVDRFIALYHGKSPDAAFEYLSEFKTV